MKITKFFLIFVMTFGFMATSNAQEASKKPIGLNFYNLSGDSPEIRGMEEECHNSETGRGTCTVTVMYNKEDTLSFPMYFIQDGDTLEYIDSADSAIGFEAVQGVEYTLLPNGVPTFLLEVRNRNGGTFLRPVIPAEQ